VFIGYLKQEQEVNFNFTRWVPVSCLALTVFIIASMSKKTHIRTLHISCVINQEVILVVPCVGRPAYRLSSLVVAYEAMCPVSILLPHAWLAH